MKYAIIGGGISGLSIANLLNIDNEVTVYEAESQPGGLIQCKYVANNLFHKTGGHVFNTKRDDVYKWFFSFFDKERQFLKAIRNSSIIIKDNKFIPYPIENFFYLLGEDLGKNIIHDLAGMLSKKADAISNFEEFLRNQFGDTLYELYFQPYNEKVWRRDLSKVPLAWLEGKLPMPTVEEILYNNIYHIKENSFVHSSFWYPKEGGSQFIADTFAEGLDIRYNSKVEIIRKSYTGKWIIENESYDRLIFCGCIKDLPQMLSSSVDISGFINDIEKLGSHGTTSVFCTIDKNPYSWIYLPCREYESHRIICTGNFSEKNNDSGKMTATIEFTDYISLEEILENIRRMPLSPQYLCHHYEKISYPIQSKNTRDVISKLKNKLAKDNLFICGRFAEWEYYNMDVCMGSAIDLYHQLINIA